MSRQAPPQLMFDDGSRAMTEESADGGSHVAEEAVTRGSTPIPDFYEVDRMTKELLSHAPIDRTFRVALQFPDSYLADSPEVCWLLETSLSGQLEIPPLVFCLGDTTVASCCPDEVAALHLQADILVHYGHACLGPTSGLPILYSFGFSSINIQAAVDCISEKMQEEKLESKNILILYDVGYQHAIQALESLLSKTTGLSVMSGKIPQPKTHGRRLRIVQSCCGGATGGADAITTGVSACCKGEKSNEEHTDANITAVADTPGQAPTVVSPGEEAQTALIVGGLELPPEISWDRLSEYTVLFIGDQGSSTRQYTNCMLRFMSLEAQPSTYLTYSPKEGSLETSLPVYLQRQLKRRFYLSQRARDANVFGIVVSTLSQSHVIDVVETLRQKIDNAGKASYSFAVGKINPAKLANFGEIDCFILVACGEHSLLDDEKEYHVPVITPLELEIALGNLEWGNQAYSLDFYDVLALSNKNSGINTAKSSQDGADESDGDQSEDAPYFSLITGQYEESAAAKKKNTPLDLENLPGQGKVAAYSSEAAQFLKQREYQGLQSLVGQTEAKPATVGQVGIASSYGGV